MDMMTVDALSRYTIIAILHTVRLLARDAFVDGIVALCRDVCPSVRLSGTDVHCDHSVHSNADLSLWLNSPMFWAP